MRQLEDLTSVGVVVASTFIDRGFDFEKIALYIEELPHFTQGRAEAVLHHAMSRWQAEASLRGIIEAVPADDARNAPSVKNDSDDADLAALFGRPVDGDHGILTFCTTPRVLKQALREYRRVWNELVGEIDLHDLLVLSVLRIAEPVGFRLVAGVASTVVLVSEQRKERWATFEKGVEASTLSPANRKALVAIAKKMFTDTPRPQSVAVRDPRDYWRRYLAVAKPVGDDCDQPLLKARLHFDRDDDPSELIDRLVEPNTGPMMEHFCRGIGFEGMLRLFDALGGRAPNLRTKHDGARPPGWGAIWRLALRTVRTGDEQSQLFQRLRDRMPEMVRANLAVAFFWDYYFATKDADIPDLLSPEQRGLIHGLLFRELVEAYGGRPQELAEALAQCHHWSIRTALHQFTAVPTGWEVFGRTLVEAANVDWEAALPTLATILIADDLPYARRGEGLFGPRAALLNMFLDREAKASWDSGVRDAFSQLAAEARHGPRPPN
jgi:hypothetical protein